MKWSSKISSSRHFQLLSNFSAKAIGKQCLNRFLRFLFQIPLFFTHKTSILFSYFTNFVTFRPQKLLQPESICPKCYSNINKRTAPIVHYIYSPIATAISSCANCAKHIKPNSYGDDDLSTSAHKCTPAVPPKRLNISTQPPQIECSRVLDNAMWYEAMWMPVFWSAIPKNEFGEFENNQTLSQRKDNGFAYFPDEKIK